MTEIFEAFGGIFAGALAGFYALIPSLGIAIVLLTVAVRLLLLPLSIKQTRSMREMQQIQPEIKRIQAKHKGNPQKRNEEMSALWKEHGVNPLGGCLPLLAQFPVLIALFYVVQAPLDYLDSLRDSRLAEALRSVPLEVNQFLGFRLDCSPSAALQGGDPQQLGEVCGGGLISSLPYLLLIVLMGLTTWYQQKQMQASRGDVSNDPQARQMQTFGKILPIMLVVFAYSFPAGVVVYWITTNTWSIGQQGIMLGGLPALAALGRREEASANGKTSSKERAKVASGKNMVKGNQKPPAAPGDGKQQADGEQADGQPKKAATGSKASSKASSKSSRSSSRSGGRSSGKKKRKR